MKKFKIEVIETLSYIVEVEAESYDIALSKVKSKYKEEEIILDSSNYVNTEFKLIK